MLVERIHQFDAAIRRIAHHVGAVCGGVDTGPLGGHTADEIIRCIDALRSNGGTSDDVQRLRAALEYVLQDDGLIPRATSECRRVVAAALAAVGTRQCRR